MVKIWIHHWYNFFQQLIIIFHLEFIVKMSLKYYKLSIFSFYFILFHFLPNTVPWLSLWSHSACMLAWWRPFVLGWVRPIGLDFPWPECGILQPCVSVNFLKWWHGMDHAPNTKYEEFWADFPTHMDIWNGSLGLHKSQQWAERWAYSLDWLLISQQVGPKEKTLAHAK